ncbi:uncharacterized protein LOC124365314 [Homalodisca vitripennis]|uniref:uncharacterized protein LOC124365314 n=1 Tax=Homalodisca vitripennis TaxID=197043 RepID=UPI001EEBCADE|nr:uncharacterized protein LOC124365314 [Homalodisca vitripennis]
MSINASKTKLMTFKRTTSSIDFNYSLDDKLLDHCTSIKDLGIVLDSSFGYSLHIDQLCCRASGMIGLIMRTARHGHGSNALVLPYKSLVLQLLEYASVVWSPYQVGLIDRLQSVQNKFLRYLHWREPDRPLNLLRLHPLVVRREVADVVFLYEFLNFVVVCPPLLERIAFRLPSGTRSRRLFELSHLNRNDLQSLRVSQATLFSKTAFLMTSLRSTIPTTASAETSPMSQ